MFSPHITKLTAVGLAVGAIAAPAASAMPIGGIPTQASASHASAVHRPTGSTNYLAQAHQLKSGSLHLFYRNVSQKQLAAKLAPPPTYSRQDKQLVPNSAPQAPVTAAPAPARVSNPGASFDWADAAIGAGSGVALSLLGLGGALALSQRRTRKPAAVATG